MKVAYGGMAIEGQCSCSDCNVALKLSHENNCKLFQQITKGDDIFTVAQNFCSSLEIYGNFLQIHSINIH